jgi:alanine-synthesizing transaminase
VNDLNALTRCRLDLEAQGIPYLDLTVTNPTLVGLVYPNAILAANTEAFQIFPYHPHPMGEWDAREAVSDYLRQQGQIGVQTQRIGLTSSTSEAYAFLFRILAKPGDEVIVMTPGYPLCDELLAWSHLKALPWPWNPSPSNPSQRWETDWKALEWSLTNATKAMVLIHPNNPTGYGLSPSDFQQAYALAERHGIAVIVDTVFRDYPLGPHPVPPIPVPAAEGQVVITLGGLSKTCALPQWKMGWAYFDGPTGKVESILAEWERWADTFLSLNTPVQRLARHLLQNRGPIQNEIRQRCQRNLDYALQRVDPPFCVDTPQAGWSLPLTLKESVEDEVLCVDLLRHAGVLVQPGYFFDYADSQHVVVSLITPPETFRTGLDKLAQFLRQT